MTSAKGSTGQAVWRYRCIPVVLVALAGCALSSYLFATSRDQERDRLEARFAEEAKRRATALRRAIEHIRHEVEMLGTYYDASQEVTRDEFRAFVGPCLAHNPAIQALEWIPRVPHAQRAAYEKAARKEGSPDFHITERKKQGQMARATRRDEYFPVHFVEPYKGNETAPGFDLASEPVRLRALEASRDTGEATASERTSLLQGDGQTFGFLLFLPVYRKGAPLDTPANRRENLEGFALGAFPIATLLESVVTCVEPAEIDVCLFDESASPAKRFLGFRPARTRGTPAQPITDREGVMEAGLRYAETMDVAGRKWMVVCTPAPGFLASGTTWTPWGIFLGGLVLTGVLMAYVLLLLRRIEYSLRFARDMSQSKRCLEQEIIERKLTQGQNRALVRMVEQSTEGMAIADLHGKLTFVNQAWSKMHGYESGGDLIGRDLGIFHSREQFEKDVVPFNRKVIRNGSHSGEVGHRREDGTAFPTLMVTSLLRDETGTPLAFAGIAKDITEERKIQEQMKRTLEELKCSNRDLEQFAYVASHDLQEPLRMVSSYTQLLAERYQDVLDKDANEFVHYAVDGCDRMRKLLESLLTLSRVGRRGKPLARTECGDVLASALKNLEVVIGENDATITYDRLPAIMADESQMVQLFQNVIANAIRYRGEAPPEVQVSAERRNGGWEFSVRDNGIGIDPEHYERIFKMFQRLHGLGEYPGTGIGLAVCKRIVARHGGNIWVESEPEKGSTFRFTIPAASDNSGSTRPTA